MNFDIPTSQYTFTFNEISNKPKKIKIESHDSGFIVKVGCKSFAFETAEKMLKHLTAYLKSPKEMEQKYNEGKLNLTK